MFDSEFEWGTDIDLFEFHLKFWNTKYWYWYLEVLVFQLEVYNKVDKLLTGLTSQQK